MTDRLTSCRPRNPDCEHAWIGSAAHGRLSRAEAIAQFRQGYRAQLEWRGNYGETSSEYSVHASIAEGLREAYEAGVVEGASRRCDGLEG